MKILVTGTTGQLGYDVVSEATEHGYEVIGASRSEFDLTNEQEVIRYVNKIQPDVIVHCAAYTAVDNAEEDRDTCWKVNVTGTEYLATVAKRNNSKFIYISTDYVFDGKGQEPYTEEMFPNPSGYYGLTKLEGEKVVQSNLDEYFILRISWVFGINGNNFIKTMLRLSETRDLLNVVSDQYGSPTYTKDLATLIIRMLQTNKYGIYHVSNEGYCNWSEFAQEIFKRSSIQTKVNPISSSQFPTKAERPKNSRLSKQKLSDQGFSLLPTWQDALERYLIELNNEVK
ncbi:dTDP-4-dehydrorhamnose reductase [Rossellomorea sp. FS2]|uniref:dTDP-4-dehydrorhamnose reductase n=1 Tax=Rossellomorea sp. FS2 TaxID=3391447 RepID=UPI003A4D3990